MKKLLEEQKNTKNTMDNIKAKIITFLLFIVFLGLMLTFKHHFSKQKHLDIKDLEQIVEEELQEAYGKN